MTFNLHTVRLYVQARQPPSIELLSEPKEDDIYVEYDEYDSEKEGKVS